jgi:hypothetical protein
MKARLTFTLPDDEMQFKRASQAFELTLSLWEISQYLREVDKYETGHTIEQIREKFYSILSDNNINLDNLIE